MRTKNKHAGMQTAGVVTSLPARFRAQEDTKRLLLVFGNVPNSHHLLSNLDSAGWDIEATWKKSTALSMIRRHPFRMGLVLIDNRRQKADLNEIERVLSENTSILWIALLTTRTGNHPALDNLVSTYCHDFFTLPLDTEKLLGTLGHAYGMQQLLAQKYPANNYSWEGLVGDSEPMRRLKKKILNVASVDASVLLTGESGSGKELTAKAIHHLSSRSQQPFVSVNCAALPTELIQSELFGHEKGSFTGAHKRHIGYIECASGGTIFLDEIGDLPVELQTNLLRFLEEKVIERIGNTEKLSIDTRVIAATNRNLEIAVRNGQFREDLYYRINVLHICVPSLREHLEDIELIAEDIYRQYINDKRPRIRGFSRQALQAMHHYEWPGNVRELINRIRHAMVMSEGRLISASDLELEDDMLEFTTTSLETSRTQAAKAAIEVALKNTCNNISQAARDLGISRTTLYRLMDKFSIEV